MVDPRPSPSGRRSTSGADGRSDEPSRRARPLDEQPARGVRRRAPDIDVNASGRAYAPPDRRVSARPPPDPELHEGGDRIQWPCARARASRCADPRACPSDSDASSSRPRRAAARGHQVQRLVRAAAAPSSSRAIARDDVASHGSMTLRRLRNALRLISWAPGAWTKHGATPEWRLRAGASATTRRRGARSVAMRPPPRSGRPIRCGRASGRRRPRTPPLMMCATSRCSRSRDRSRRAARAQTARCRAGRSCG